MLLKTYEVHFFIGQSPLYIKAVKMLGNPPDAVTFHGNSGVLVATATGVKAVIVTGGEDK